MGKDRTEPSINPATSTNISKVEIERNALIGEAIDFQRVQTALLEVEVMDVIGDNYFRKEVSEGGTYVAVVWQMKNISDKPIGMFEHPSMNLIDDKGTEYTNDIAASGYYAAQKKVDNSKILSDLNPGITVTDTAVFEVSKELFNSNTWKIKFEHRGKSKLVDLN